MSLLLTRGIEYISIKPFSSSLTELGSALICGKCPGGVVSFLIEPSTEGTDRVVWELEAWGRVGTERLGDWVDERRLILVLRLFQIALFLVSIGYKNII